MNHFKAILSIAVITLVPHGLSAESEYWKKLLDVTVDHIKKEGPGYEVAEFIMLAGRDAFPRHMEIVRAVAPYFKDADANKVSGALSVAYRVAGYHPRAGFMSEEESVAHGKTIAFLDGEVLKYLDHYHSLRDNLVLQKLALNLARIRTKQSKTELLRIVNSDHAKGAKGQALVCLGWHRDKEDMKVLFEIMMGDTDEAGELPYIFRHNYGEDAVYYLERAMRSAKSMRVRREAKQQLGFLDKMLREE
jgi:hypothetical protein